MHVLVNIKTIINHPDFFSYLIGLILSTLLIGYAPSSIAFGVFLFFVLRFTIINKPKFKVSPMLLLPIGLYLLFCCSYFWSVDTKNTIKGIERFVPLFLFPIAFSVIPKFSKKQYNIVLNIFTKSNVLFGVLFLLSASLNYFKTKSLDVFTYHNLVSILDLNAIYVSVFFSFSYFYLLSKKNKSKLEKLSLFFLGLIILLLSSKMLITAFLICNLLFLFFYKKVEYFKSIKAILSILVLTIVFGISSSQVYDRFFEETRTDYDEVLHSEKFNRVYPWTGSSIRILQLRILKDQIEEEDIFWRGFGLYASRENLRERHLNFNTYKGYHEYNYHNLYAQFLSELGIFGLLYLLVILVLNTRKAIKSKVFLFLVFNIIFMMMFLTESFLWVHRGMFLFIIFFCLFNSTMFLKKHTITN
ncbi:O-antigen ligase-like membrane protein [Oceanihabitans sediminis]|uniref:O-antigen ligase-related domain-containing protein n=1 Tax=Oceanihabitans sediminis TaxID=1812012 RepID=A0A368P8S4_9FLAO|nr:O-antigen ligase-like membrane protein [Oceanihabitans sediminis]RCU58315.1 hypothetical protein DU428_02775 [Oceanihabitans sediminis]